MVRLSVVDLVNSKLVGESETAEQGMGLEGEKTVELISVKCSTPYPGCFTHNKISLVNPANNVEVGAHHVLTCPNVRSLVSVTLA